VFKRWEKSEFDKWAEANLIAGCYPNFTILEFGKKNLKKTNKTRAFIQQKKIYIYIYIN